MVNASIHKKPAQAGFFVAFFNKLIYTNLMKITKQDEKFIDEAIEISKKEKYPFGAIIVKNGKIIGRSNNLEKEFGTRLYSHSEYRAVIDANRSGHAGPREGGLYGGLEGCTIYTSCQPCIICMGVLLYKGIKKIVYAAKLEDSSKYVTKEIEADPQGLVDLAGIKDIEIIGALHREKAVEVLKQYVEYEENLPK